MNTNVEQSSESAKNGILDLISIDKVKSIDNRLFVIYDYAMDLLNKSKHFHQREKRQRKYPQHIKFDHNCYYISLQYLETLYLYNNQAEQLKALKSSI
jgi:hypothetical protein